MKKILSFLHNIKGFAKGFAAHSRRAAKKRSALCALFLTAVMSAGLLCIPSGAESVKLNKNYYIKVFSAGISVRKGPGTSYELLGKTGGSSKFDYIGAAFDSVDILWYKIQDKNGLIGWISSNYARRYPKKKISMPENDYVSDGTPFSDIQALVYEAAAQYGAVGVQVAAVRGKDGKIFDWTYGYAKKGEDDMERTTKLRTASISKVMTAICAEKMQEDGIIRMSRRIDSYWGKKLPVGISLLTMMTHTSSLSYLSIKTNKADYLSQLLEKSNYTGERPGSAAAWGYNNYAYSAAAATLELASGELLYEYAKEKVFSPMGLDVSFFTGDIENTDDLAFHYDADGSVELTRAEAKALLPKNEPVADAGAYIGGFTGSARDVAKIFYMLSNDGKYGRKRILEKESVSALEKKYIKAEEYGGEFYQCVGLRYMRSLCGTKGLYYHTGNAYGVIALASYDPVNKNAVVVLTTGAAHDRDENGIYAVCTKISEGIYGAIGDL